MTLPTYPRHDDRAAPCPRRSPSAVRLSAWGAALGLALAGTGCAVASATAGAAISVTGAVVSTGIGLTGKAIGAGIDAASGPAKAPDRSGIVVHERIRGAPTDGSAPAATTRPCPPATGDAAPTASAQDACP